MKTNKIILLIISIVVVSIQFIFLTNYKISENIVGNIITFISVLFGFYITSFAIFVTSKYITTLYKMIDTEDNSQTLLHRLLGNYKWGLVLALISIIYFLFIGYIISNSTNKELTMSNWYTYPFIALILINVIYAYYMLSDLIRVILQDAKTEK